MKLRLATVVRVLSFALAACGGQLATPDAGNDAATDVRNDTYHFGDTGPDFDAGEDSGGTVFAAAQRPLAIAVDSTNVYWRTSTLGGGNVMECPLTGCNGPPVRLAFNQGDALSVGSDGKTVFWPSPTTHAIVQCGVGGCAEAPTMLASSTLDARMAVSGSSVFWTESSAPDAGRVVECATTGCGGNPAVFASGQVNPSAVTADAVNVYWGTDGTGANAVGGVWTCPITGCVGSPTSLWSGSDALGGIASNGTTVVWTLVSGGTVMQCSVAGCGGNPTVLASGLSSPFAITVDSTTAYWITNTAVVKCALSGCANSPTILATGTYGVAGIAVSATTLFWADYNRAALMSLALQ